MTLYGCFRTSIIRCLGLPIALLILACPALDIAKIVIFHHTNGELKINDVEYAYLSFSFSMVVILFCCTLCISRGYINAAESTSKPLSCLLPCIWIAVLVIYSVSTKDELGDIPFFCPSSYNYTSTRIHLACQIRAANFISVWLLTTFVIFFSLCLLAFPPEGERPVKSYEKLHEVEKVNKIDRTDKDDKTDKTDKDDKVDKVV